jgi:glyoxylase-like metal-dependent hydrolase (beta-lactamase superfamily II)
MISNYVDAAPGWRVRPVRGPAGFFHLLHDVARNEAVLVDTGLAGELPALERALQDAGLSWRSISAILLTHGHLDHTGNLARIKALTGAPVLAHPLEQSHIDGTHPYRGVSRVCGALEAAGRRLWRYRTVRIDEPLADGLQLPFWGGLRVVHLPGHTAGHCGFFSPACDLLFCGDLFADYAFSTHLPPPFLNCCPELFPETLRKVTTLAPGRMIPNHYDRLDPAGHRRRFDELVRRQTAGRPLHAPAGGNSASSR